jgi:TonB-linked SusC/RagA family outer membrane protein
MRKFTNLIFLIFICIGFITAQTTKVTGKVISEEDGQSVIGASVIVKGHTAIGTVTDFDGNFSLDVPESAKTLIFSFIGLATQEVPVSSYISVTLKPDSRLLDEVIVIAYGTARKSSFTGSAKAVHTEEITSGSRESLDKAIMGKIAGVRVTSNTGDPGAPGDINIRGVGSISASTAPLYVIDGIPIVNDNDMIYYGKASSILTSLNPDDIESMTVLKDAAAASLYGSRAANGVIIITTKSGKAGKTKVSYSSEVGWNSLAAKNQLKPMGAKDLVEYAKEALANYYIYYGYAENKEEGYALVQSEGDLEYFFNDPFGNTNTDWRNEVYGTALTQDHQISLNGGSENTKFYAGFGYNNSDGIVLGTSFERFSGRINLDHNVNKWLSVSLKQMISYSDQEGVRDQNDQTQGLGTSSPMSLVFSGDPTAPVKNPDGTYNADALWGAASNPHLMLGIQEWVKSKNMRSLTNIEASIAFSDKVKLKSILGYDFIDTKHFEFWSPEGVNGGAIGGLGSRYLFENRTLTSSTTLNYANTWNDVHNLELLGGFEMEDRNLTQIIATAQKYSTDKLPELGNGQPDNAYSNIYGAGIVSFLSSVQYNYDSKYYLSSSFRRDGSSRLGVDNHWANFWSLSGAWRISKEGFLQDNKLFNDFKIRASYGTNGTLPTEYYSNLALYSFSAGYGPNPAIYWSQPGNANLGWEKSRNINVGFDWNLYNRVGITVEYYNRLTSDLLFKVPSSMVTGFEESWQNLGKIKNDGLEIEVVSQNLNINNFSWQTNLNLTWQRAIIDELPDGKDIQYGDGSMFLHREGESLYTFYLPVWKGVNPETGFGQFLKDGSNPNSEIVNNYAEVTGYGIVGKAVPDVTGGLTNTLKYRDFDLNFLITYQFGGDMFDYPGYFFHHDGVRIGSLNLENDVAGNYWKNPGDIVDYPKPIYSNPTRPDRFSSRTIVSSDNIRMREITFGYKVPLFKGVIDNLRFYFRANNPFMIWSKSDRVDPDIPLNGYRQVDTPQIRSFVFGVNVNF